LQKIVVFDMESLSAFNDSMVLSRRIPHFGRNVSPGGKGGQWDAMSGSRSADDLAILVYPVGPRPARPRARCIPIAA